MVLNCPSSSMDAQKAGDPVVKSNKLFEWEKIKAVGLIQIYLVPQNVQKSSAEAEENVFGSVVL